VTTSYFATDPTEVKISVSAVVTRHEKPGEILLMRRSDNEHWGLPGGYVEPGESVVAATQREVREETGLTRLDVGPSLGTIDWYFMSEDDLVHKFCDYFLMASPNGDPSPEVSEGITECQWLPVKEAIATVAYDNAREVVVRAAEVLNSGEADELL